MTLVLREIAFAADEDVALREVRFDPDLDAGRRFERGIRQQKPRSRLAEIREYAGGLGRRCSLGDRRTECARLVDALHAADDRRCRVVRIGCAVLRDEPGRTHEGRNDEQSSLNDASHPQPPRRDVSLQRRIHSELRTQN
jgi:hypothetical protein